MLKTLSRLVDYLINNFEIIFEILNLKLISLELETSRTVGYDIGAATTPVKDESKTEADSFLKLAINMLLTFVHLTLVSTVLKIV